MTAPTPSPQQLPPKLAIIGLGLMGGSLGLAAKAHGRHVAAYARRKQSLTEALAAEIADEGFESAAEAVKGADLIVLCTPLLTMPNLVREFLPNLKEGCIITDVGSTKQYLSEELEKLLAGTPAEFIGSHPMTGSEKNGIEAADAQLYRDAAVIVTPTANTTDKSKQQVINFWQELGAQVTEMTPKQHDEIIARTSHLPHLAAAALMASADRDKTDITPFCGPGIRDTTRIAEGSEHIWHDIIKTNTEPILQELNNLQHTLDNLKTMLEQKNFDAIRQLLANSRQKRKKLN